MPEQRSVLKEYRYLDEKRLTQGLSPEEETRFVRLRELVGTEGAPAVRPGFDVNAAAAALRESLLPAGLRHRPPPTPAPAPAQPEPAPAEPEMAEALASVFEQAPFAPLDEGAPADALFDPSTLGSEPPPYDPSAQPYDPNAPYPADAAYDASGQPAWDPNQPWDPNAAPDAQPYDPNAPYPADAAYDASGQPAWDPNAAPEAQPYDPSAAYPADAAYDPNAPYPADAASDASGQPAWDPNAVAQAETYPGDAAPPEGGSFQAGDAAPEAQPYDPNAAYPADAGAQDEVQGWDPNAVAQGEAYPGDAAPPEGGSFQTGDAGTAAGWDVEPPPPETTPGAAFGEYDAAGAEPPFEGALLGDVPPPEAEYLPEPPGPAEASTVPELGEYDDTAGFAAAPFEASAVREDALALESARPPPELDTNWQPETALDAGFHLESGGSFGAGADAAAPEWAQASEPPPWEGAPALDIGAPPEPADDEGSQGYEISPAPQAETFGTLPAAGGDLFAAPQGDLAPADGLAAHPPEGAAPDLDFSQPDFSGPEDVRPEPPVESAPADGALDAFAAEIPELPPEEGGVGSFAADLGLEPASAKADAEVAVAFEPEPEPELAVALEPAPEHPVAELGVAELPEETGGAPAAGDLSFHVAEELPAAGPREAALTAPAPTTDVIADDDIPTIDGEDILEEIVDDVPAEPPQSLDFASLPQEPLPPPPAIAQAPAPPQPPPPDARPATATRPPVLTPPPAAAVEPAAPALASTPACHIPGSHRVVVHTLEGLVRRGVLEDPDLDASALPLAPQPGAPAEDVPTDRVKAIFFMLAPGETAPAAEGRRVRVTFRDGRQIAGFSPDYREDGIGFFMIPADTKTNTGRIWVFRAAVRQVAVS